MSRSRITRDELYLIKLYEEGQKLGDIYAEVDRYHIGAIIGQNNKSVDNMVRMLAQANFVKKGSGNNIYLTRQGEVLIEDLL